MEITKNKITEIFCIIDARKTTVAYPELRLLTL